MTSNKSDIMYITRIDLYKYTVDIPPVKFLNNISASQNESIFVVIKISTDQHFTGFSMAGHFVHQTYY